MLKEMVEERLIGEFTTVREELLDMAEELIEEIGDEESTATLCGDYVFIENEEESIRLRIECAGRTWYFDKCEER